MCPLPATFNIRPSIRGFDRNPAASAFHFNRTLLRAAYIERLLLPSANLSNLQIFKNLKVRKVFKISPVPTGPVSSSVFGTAVGLIKASHMARAVTQKSDQVKKRLQATYSAAMDVVTHMGGFEATPLY